MLGKRTIAKTNSKFEYETIGKENCQAVLVKEKIICFSLFLALTKLN